MTREEREDAINCFKNKLENEVFGAKYNKLALEALEQDPTTKASITMLRLDYEARLKADMVALLDRVRADIIKYEADCRLSVDEYPSCKQCTDNVFESIYGILDKYKAGSEDK